MDPSAAAREAGYRQKASLERSGAMYAQVMEHSPLDAAIAALREEPGFSASAETPSGRHIVVWESESTARRPKLEFGGRLLNVYRASGRPA
jgi:hypothetical protein